MTHPFPRGAGRLTAVLPLLVAFLLTGCDSDAPAPQGQAESPPAVIVEAVQLKDVTEERSFTGRIEAIEKVQIRARVQGFLKKRAFEEGAEIDKGQLLFEIEREPYEVAVDQAEANLANAQAALTLARQNYDRTSALARSNTASRAALDTAQTQLSQAQAAVQAQQAALRSAQLDLGYTRIAAPIDGRVGRAAYSVGNLVSIDSNPLVTLVAQDPMYVTFPVPQWLLLEVRKEGRGPDSVFVKLRLADGTIYDQEGQIQFVDVESTSSTDSVMVRASIANPDRLLVDQQLVTVMVVTKQPERRLVVSQSAILLDQQGPYVLGVDGDSKATIRRIAVGEQRGPLIVVKSGLAEGDRVVVSGHQKVRPGMTVAASQAGNSDTPPDSTARQ
ncbi:MAG: efflux RND transporter periplasmic adaptor subunit [Alphaproteobacteria bacterium]